MKKDYDYEQMLSGNLYLAHGINKEHQSIHGKKIMQKINSLPIENTKEIIKLEKELFNKTGHNIYLHPPVYVDYGSHTEIGENFYANMDCILLDVNRIIIGNNVMFGPRVSLFTAGHPIDPTIRNTGLEFGLPIVIEDNVWIGGNVSVLPGVTIHENAIVAAGSIVTKDVPKNSIVGGNPAKVIRYITDEDHKHWKQKQDYYYHNKLK